MDIIYPSQVIPMPLQQNAVNIDFSQHYQKDCQTLFKK